MIARIIISAVLTLVCVTGIAGADDAPKAKPSPVETAREHVGPTHGERILGANCRNCLS